MQQCLLWPCWPFAADASLVRCAWTLSSTPPYMQAVPPGRKWGGHFQTLGFILSGHPQPKLLLVERKLSGLPLAAPAAWIGPSKIIGWSTHMFFQLSIYL